ncbi:hypothetical protein EDEG_03746 [Edhazardia aedis USNM 41457]|uniref:Uncharacterized protein n=1 Tax=Edhazardia aedis (strain USNM 41457) TaxID=1003232 RepID=J9DGK3_EDHAE|nr:hypothetical protein EDEG_03746 [Edhazardia aedis USNM 41457]|eukprot:EJW01730.1 hypothetical protein EDEG_03746 [Edhazardia aedis USNM 41457]
MKLVLLFYIVFKFIIASDQIRIAQKTPEENESGQSVLWGKAGLDLFKAIECAERYASDFCRSTMPKVPYRNKNDDTRLQEIVERISDIRSRLEKMKDEEKNSDCVFDKNDHT